MPRPTDVKPLDTYRIWVKYSDGAEGIVDLTHLAGKGVFALWNAPGAFQDVHIGPSGEIAWSDEIDLCPRLDLSQDHRQEARGILCCPVLTSFR